MTIIRRWLAGAPVCLSALLGLGMPAQAAEGREVSGGDRSDRAAEVIAGASLDRGDTATGELWYRYRRTISQSTVMISASAPGAEAADSLEIQATTEDGTSCGSDTAYGFGDGTPPMAVGLTVGYAEQATPDEPCLDDELLVKVAPPSPGTPVTLTVWEEPEIVNTSELSPGVESDTPSWSEPDVDDAGEVTPGDDAASAPLLADGSYSGTIAPGEVQVFRVRLEWGDVLSAQLLTPALTPEQQEGSLYSATELALYNPVGMANEDDPTSESSSGTIGSTSPDSIATGTVSVEALNRFTGSSSFVPGDYTLVYAAQPDSDGATDRFPYTLDVQVSHEETIEPRYADGRELLTGDTGADAEDDGGATSIVPGSARILAGVSMAILSAACLVAGLRMLRRSRG